ncbi:type I-E CRISPR-associated protein Cse1/CasA [Inmirania thermothiophila]|uniref:CRISPR-associated Cse1 family protein n=1 Tax=Inmirania thermothiophila TaxID=1750597 RepID=A0A3N1Y1K3_9GAMM|nr:type I-E CRISPR-associated protein Cse1/CasA [Inmirania thermothiophila]ROR32699.1 CRISPR-associated Cse1 family protein [Inmirania thermothiophila]
MNLLTDPLVPVTTAQGQTFVNLPALLAGLGDDTVRRIDGLQRHQEDAFHVFLCYLAGAVLARDGDWNPVRDEAFWRDGMRFLAGDAGDDAWRLVVDDLSRPAFMQPPLPKADHGKLKLQAETPDALDLLPTAKNHDLKQARAARAQPHEWLYALVSLQTMSGYFGRGNPGIARMNSGFGNRPVVEVARSREQAPRWRDVVLRLEAHRRQVLAGSLPFRDDGLVLVWLRFWDGKTSLSLSELDPFFLEICRRVRLQGDGEQITQAAGLPSDANRIAAKEQNGLVGDAWLPEDHSDKKGAKALTVSADGWTADRLRRLLFEDGIRHTLLQKPAPDWEGDVWLLASVLVRGQGTTDGFHERHLLIPAQVKRRLFAPKPQVDPLAALAKEAVELAGLMQNRVLKPAVLVLAQGAPEKLAFDDDTTSAWWQRFAARFGNRWSDEYFPWLWSLPDPLDRAEARLDWARRLKAHAETVLHEAERILPQHTGRLWHARVAARRAFNGALYKHFPDLKEARHERIA